MEIKNRDLLFKYLWFYKMLPCRFTSNDKSISEFIYALNIKNRYKRIKYIVDNGITIIDNYYKDKNGCKFINDKCICHRVRNLKYINGCCRKCKYFKDRSCSTLNVACKLFYCSYTKLDKIRFEDIDIFKLLSIRQRYVLKNSYFVKYEDILFDLYCGPIFCFIRGIFRFILNWRML